MIFELLLTTLALTGLPLAVSFLLVKTSKGKKKGAGKKSSGKTSSKTPAKGRTKPGSRSGGSGRARGVPDRPKNWDKLPFDVKIKYAKKLFDGGRITHDQYLSLVSKIHLKESLRMSKTVAKPTPLDFRVYDTTKLGRKKVQGKKNRSVSKKMPTRGKGRSRPRKKELDFEDELRREVGLKKKKELSFEEELRSISKKVSSTGTAPGRSRRTKDTLFSSMDASGEYVLPPVEIFEAEFKEGPHIDEIFIMNENGLLIRHIAFGESSKVDEDILASMIVVVQNFIHDSFSSADASLKELNMGDFNILITQGDFITTVSISSDDDLKALDKGLEAMIREIEMINNNLRENWSGDLGDFKGVEECLEKLTNNEY